MKSNILKRFAQKLNDNADKAMKDGGNIPFTRNELREQWAYNPKERVILNEYPNRMERRSMISARNLRRYNLRIGDAVQQYEMMKLKAMSLSH